MFWSWLGLFRVGKWQINRTITERSLGKQLPPVRCGGVIGTVASGGPYNHIFIPAEAEFTTRADTVKARPVAATFGSYSGRLYAFRLGPQPRSMSGNNGRFRNVLRFQSSGTLSLGYKLVFSDVRVVRCVYEAKSTVGFWFDALIHACEMGYQ